MKLTTRIIAGSAVALSLAAGLAVAHPGFGGGYGPGYGMGWGMGPGMGMGWGPGGMGMGFGMGAYGGPADEATIAARLSELKATLKITPAQESAWLAFENGAKQQAATMRAMHEQVRSGNAVDPATWHQTMFSAHSAQRNAFFDLYAVLTPEQRDIADRFGGFGGRFGARPYGPQGR